MVQTRYAGFDVMEQADAWDEHTRSIVERRVRSTSHFEQLTPHEVEQLRRVVAHLLYEDRSDLIDYVVKHFDTKLADKKGEGERKSTVPPLEALIRQGLAGLDDVARARFGCGFLECDTRQQFEVLADLQNGALEPAGYMASIPQKDLFNKLLRLAVESFASHPRIWSEMGYAGPAYPRGYYRIERGLTDPWEPKAAPGGDES